MEDNNHFLKGLIIGGVAAGIGALLMAPKSGEALRNEIKDTYHDVADKTESLKDELKHKSWHMLHPHGDCPTCNGAKPYFTAGTAAGAALGALTALMLTSKSGTNFRRGMEKTVHGLADQGEEFKDHVSDFIHNLQGSLGEHGGKRSSHLNNFLSAVTTGLHLWQNLQKRK